MRGSCNFKRKVSLLPQKTRSVFGCLLGDTFYNLSFKDKEKFVGVVLAYSYSISKETIMVLIYDNKNNKKVGSYNAVNGLVLN